MKTSAEAFFFFFFFTYRQNGTLMIQLLCSTNQYERKITEHLVLIHSIIRMSLSL